MYKAFVSSTFDDLLKHRSEVIRTIQASGIQVDPMESWQADRATPGEFSSNRMVNCDICILLVAFRRGTVPTGEARSIVQIEYDEARRRGIDVLPFLLRDDVSVGTGGWPLEFDERDKDPAVAQWRLQLRHSHGLGDFGVDPKSLRIEAALARWVIQRVADRNKMQRRATLAVSGALLSVIAILIAWIGYVYTTPSQRSAMHGRFLAFHDPAVFNSSPEARYLIARVLPDRDALVHNTNFSKEIRDTRESFDILINNGQFIKNYQSENFRYLVQRGVHLRFVISDYTAAGRSFESFHLATGLSVVESKEGSREWRSYLLKLQKEIASEPGKFHGSLAIRWNPKPLLYTMWIRDWSTSGSPSALGHLGVHLYRGQTHWPVFRTSFRDGMELINNLHEEFEAAWAGSTPELENPSRQ